MESLRSLRLLCVSAVKALSLTAETQRRRKGRRENLAGKTREAPSAPTVEGLNVIGEPTVAQVANLRYAGAPTNRI